MAHFSSQALGCVHWLSGDVIKELKRFDIHTQLFTGHPFFFLFTTEVLEWFGVFGVVPIRLISDNISIAERMPKTALNTKVSGRSGSSNHN